MRAGESQAIGASVKSSCSIVMIIILIYNGVFLHEKVKMSTFIGKNKIFWILLGMFTSWMSCSWAHADANDYVATPKVEAGEKEVDFKSGVKRNRDGSSQAANSLGLGYGVNERWFTEVYAKYARSPNMGSTFDAWEWENKFQLTDAKDWAIVGFLLEIEKPQDTGAGIELTYGPLLQKSWGRLQGNFNILIQKNVNATQPFNTELHYQAQLKWRETSAFQWGAQAFGNVGSQESLVVGAPSAMQEQNIGPAVFGRWSTGAREGIKWNAAWLRGETQATPSSTIRLQVEYEYY